MEVCVDNVASALNAAAGGASRLELCSSLAEGGLTPSPGMLAQLKRQTSSLPIFVLIRPRGGDFLYDKAEIDIMKKDIEIGLEYGADGFVFGCLDAQGHVDERACSLLLGACQGKPATFHRAFDMALDPVQTAEKLIALGFARILTSGQAKTAWAGRMLLKELRIKFGSKITIMPGGGITVDNLDELLGTSGCAEFHASARANVPSRMEFRNERCSMGSNSEEFSLKVTCRNKVSALVALFDSMKINQK